MGCSVADDQSFQSLIRRVRLGDEAAAAVLVRRYEPHIRRVVHVRLLHSPLRRHFDSMDVCQSVLGSFFLRAALGQYELDSPGQLVRLLAAIARNKLADQARKRHGVPADPVAGRAAAERDLDAVAAAEPSPSRRAEARDLLDQVRGRLDDDERAVADRRALGREWADIAAELGGTADALRKKLSRALDRVARDLKLEA
jgi:RNA polymerase sigma-70 factor (ECF subfamily)